jgi:hypothetical protein
MSCPSLAPLSLDQFDATGHHGDPEQGQHSIEQRVVLEPSEALGEEQEVAGYCECEAQAEALLFIHHETPITRSACA